jgi:S-adenosyl-L-methionine hydrolase (adenosine-forming)
MDYNYLMTSPLIAIMTDFGTQDPYVGILKGVIAGLAPGVQTIDLTHEIPPGDIRRAAVQLWQSVSYFPAGTLFLAVVDPGVGTSRRPMLLQAQVGPSAASYSFAGPDNGLFTFMLQENFQAWEISNPAYMLPGPSKTFHGRDIFAPAAAYLANGIPAQNFGAVICDPVRLALPRLEYTEQHTLAGEVLYADTFGNLLTSLGRFDRQAGGFLEFIPWLPGLDSTNLPIQDMKIKLPDGKLLSLTGTFGEIIPGNCAALIGSSGLIEIASNQASAADLLELRAGETVYLLY